MSKNFRSSFIDLLCCRYSKRNHFEMNESLRNRRITDNRTSFFFKADYLLRTSVVSRFSQLSPRTTLVGATSPSLSRITHELSPMHTLNDERKMSTEAHSPHHVVVELSETDRRRIQSDLLPVVSYCSLVPKT
jgi:hypothetical protein